MLHLAHTRLTDAGAEDVAKVLSFLALLVQKYKYSRAGGSGICEQVLSLLALLVQKYKYSRSIRC